MVTVVKTESISSATTAVLSMVNGDNERMMQAVMTELKVKEWFIKVIWNTSKCFKRNTKHYRYRKSEINTEHWNCCLFQVL